MVLVSVPEALETTRKASPPVRDEAVIVNASAVVAVESRALAAVPESISNAALRSKRPDAVIVVQVTAPVERVDAPLSIFPKF